MPLAERPRDDGVTPVIGMIFVLAFSVVSILTTLYWGLPLLDEMKAVSEFKTAGNQFNDLLVQLQDLTSGTAVNTAKRWDPALSQGTLTVHEDTNRWAIQVDQHATNRVFLRNVMNDTNEFAFSIPASAGAWNVTPTDPTNDFVYVSAVRVASGQEYPLVVHDPAAGATVSARGMLITRGQWATLELYESDGVTETSLSGNVIKVTFQKQLNAACLTGTPTDCAYHPLATFWSFDMGDVTYTVPAGKTTREMVLSNGAILKGNAGDLYVGNEPAALTSTEDDPTGARFFARVLQITGGGSFGGEAQFGLVLTLRSTSSLASEVAAHGIKIYFEDGDASDAWISHLTEDTADPAFEDHSIPLDTWYPGTGSTPATTTNTDFVEYWSEDAFTFSLLHSEISMGGA